MSKDPLYKHLREISWQRKLTAEEEMRLSECLAAHPEVHADWELETELNQVLGALPNVPVANNFTARVLDAASREAIADERTHRRSHSAWWSRWLPKAALAAVVLAAGLLSYHHVQETRREEVARSLNTISQLPSVPSPEVLKDFDTIAAMSSTPPADEELLKVMQ